MGLTKRTMWSEADVIRPALGEQYADQDGSSHSAIAAIFLTSVTPPACAKSGCRRSMQAASCTATAGVSTYPLSAAGRVDDIPDTV